MLWVDRQKIAQIESNVADALRSQNRIEPRLEIVETRSTQNETNLKHTINGKEAFVIALQVLGGASVILAAIGIATAFWLNRDDPAPSSKETANTEIAAPSAEATQTSLPEDPDGNTSEVKNKQ